MGVDIQSYKDQISNVIPFDIGSLKVHEGGDDFLVFEVNSEWMFRFPRTDLSQKALEKEMLLLAEFKHLSPLPVPDYQYAGKGFAGYAKIHGRQFSREVFQGLSKNIRQEIAKQLGNFLSALHNFPLGKATEIGLTQGWNGVHHNNGRAFLEKVAPLLTPSTRNKTARCMENVLASEFRGTVIHGDFYLPDHVFFDKAKHQPGVIDFADATIYDPAHDLQCVYEIGGDDFFEAIMNDYAGDKDADLLKRSKLRLLARPLFTAGSVFSNGLEDQYGPQLARIEEAFS